MKTPVQFPSLLSPRRVVGQSLEGTGLVSSWPLEVSGRARHLVFSEGQRCLSDQQRKNVNFPFSLDFTFQNCLCWRNINSIATLLFPTLSTVLLPEPRSAAVRSPFHRILQTLNCPWMPRGLHTALGQTADQRTRQNPWKLPDGHLIPADKEVPGEGKRDHRASCFLTKRLRLFTKSPSLGGEMRHNGRAKHRAQKRTNGEAFQPTHPDTHRNPDSRSQRKQARREALTPTP